MILYTCPNCGKSHSARDGNAGRRGVCGCGTLLLVPQVGELPSRPSADVPASLSPQVDRLAWFAGIGGSVIGLVIVASVVYVLFFHNAWERDNRTHLLDLKGEAERMVVGKEYAKAKAKYDELFGLIGDRVVSDVALAKDVGQARADLEELGKRIASIERLRREDEARQAEAQEASRRDALARQAKAARDTLDRQREADAEKQRIAAIAREAAFDRLSAVTHSPVAVNVRGNKLQIEYPLSQLYVAGSTIQIRGEPVFFGRCPTLFFRCTVDGAYDTEHFFKVARVPQRITFASDRPEVVRVDEGGSIYAGRPGRAIVTISLAGVDTQIPIEVRELPVNVGISSEALIAALGLPDDRKAVSFAWPEGGTVDNISYTTLLPNHQFVSADHWRYRKFQNVVFVIENSKFSNLANVEPASR